MNSEDIQNIFFAECEESLEAAEDGLNACKAGTHDDETINAIFRAVHSIKGGAGAFGHEPLQAFTHCFETLLADIRDGSVALDEELVDLLLLALDCLHDHVGAAQSQTAPPEDQPLIERLTAAQAANQPEDPPAETEKQAPEPAPAESVPGAEDVDSLLDEFFGPDADGASESDGNADDSQIDDAGAGSWLVHIRPHAGAMLNGNEPLVWLRELAELGGSCKACDVFNVPTLAEFQIEQGYLGWTFEMPAAVERERVEDIFDFAGDACSLDFGEEAVIPPVQISPAPAGSGKELETPVEAPASAAAPDTNPPAKEAAPSPAKTTSGAKATPPAKSKAASSSGQSIRIDLEKLDRMIDGVGELVIAQAMLTQRLANEDVAHIEELAMLENLVRDIQEHAMAFRAQPISSVFSRVPRLLRELAGTTGKHVKLDVSGETTELDKTVIERLSEPLTHLIRNAVDHGIEDVEDRLEAGKNAEGTLSLSAEQKAGRILIRIGDDGRGIDRSKLLKKAIANGVIAEDAQPSDEDICNLVFSPGLSTAKEVSNISGRGVGMDVVRQNVKDLGGRITIESTPGEGTTFILALPLTLAISDGMIVQVGEQSLVIPLAHVVESLRPEASDLKGMGTTRQMLNIRGHFVPILPLNPIIDPERECSDPREGVLVVVETEAHGQAALLVDEITDQRQFVIKSLDTNFHSVDSIAGATILGNGRVALIVDVDRLIQSTPDPQALKAAA